MINIATIRWFGAQGKSWNLSLVAAGRSNLDGRVLSKRLGDEVRAFTSALIEPDALALYRLIVADGWRFPDLARAFEHAGMRVIRQRIEAILELGGVPSDQAEALGGEVVALALGDVYQRAVLGIAEAGDHMAFARQIEVAAAHGFGGRAARSSRSLAPKALRPR